MQLQTDLPDTGSAIQTAPVAYTRIPDAVLLDPRLTPGQLRIYAVIARRADRDKATAFPSYKTIAKDAHVSRTSAIDGVKALVQLGYLSKQAQESGQGDPTSNLYTISGEGSQMFVLPRPITTPDTPEAAQKLDRRSADFAPRVVQPFDRGGANIGPEQESFNKKKKNKSQENGRTHTQAREVASTPAAAAEPELQKLLNDFQENIGTLTNMSEDVLCQLAAQHGTDWVHDAIKEAVIYEKRSLAYIRRVLEAWKRNGRASENAARVEHAGGQTPTANTSEHQEVGTDLPWPPPGLFEDYQEMSMSNGEDPAVKAWIAISDRLPEFNRMIKLVTPQSLVGNLLTVMTSDQRTYDVLANARRYFIDIATRAVLGDEAQIHIELIESAVGTAGSNASCAHFTSVPLA